MPIPVGREVAARVARLGFERAELLGGHCSVADEPAKAEGPQAGELLHHKYKIPARCFAYVGNAADPATWHLPYMLPDGNPDTKRLSGAIQAILSNYRGARLSSVPEKDIPDVLVRLAKAAASLGKMPYQSPNAAAAYVQLEEVLRQLDRLGEIAGASGSSG